MTTKDFKKMLKQLKSKPVKMAKFLKHNSPKKRATGQALYKCGRCGRHGARVSKYGLELCRCCFREIATKIGFKKYS